MKNQQRYIKFWLAVLLTSIIISLLGCAKEPMYNLDCGIIQVKNYSNGLWTVVYKWNDGSRDTILWHFDIISAVGDSVCKLKEIDLSDYECQP